MSVFTYPTSAELRLIAQELVPQLQANRVVFDFFPTRDVDSPVVAWDQIDNYVGLQQVRGLNGEPPRVKPIGGKRYVMNPGVYGEFALIDELEITTRRQYGTFNAPISLDDLVMQKQRQLLGRRLDRQESQIWTLLATGTFSSSDNPGGSVLHTDSYTTQVYSAGVAWATSATATPLADVRAVQLKSRGYSVDFGARAKMYMNRSTMNAILSNTNPADLGGRRGAGLSSINGPAQVNELLAMDDLPNIVVYDRGYLDDSGTFQLFVPNNKVIVIGARLDNDPVGEFQMTRNANNPNSAPGAYTKIIDRGEDTVPRSIEVHDGWNGGLALFHPAAIVVMTV